MGKVTLPKAQATGIPQSERAARVPNKSVLRLAPKAVLTPDELSRLQQQAGNTAVVELIAHRVDAVISGRPVNYAEPILVSEDESPESEGVDAGGGLTGIGPSAYSPVEGLGGDQKGPGAAPYVYSAVEDFEPEGKGSARPAHAYSPVEGLEGDQKGPGAAPYVYSEVDLEAEEEQGEERPSSVRVPKQSKPLKSPIRYTSERKRDKAYKKEFTKGSHILGTIVNSVEAAVAEGKVASVAVAMQRAMGWSAEDCAKYLDKVHLIGTEDPERPTVAKVSEEDRGDLELHGGSPLTQGKGTDAYDTRALFSKFSGRGFAIWVMDSGGRFFAAQHKVGLFHHSSFLAGGNVAGAGEMKVEAGSLKQITNKSGHYLPRSEEMIQVFAELQSRGVNLASVVYVHMTGDDTRQKAGPWPGGAEDFYRKYKDDPAAAPH